MIIELEVAKKVEELTLNGLTYNEALSLAKEKYIKELSETEQNLSDSSIKISK